MLTGTRRRKLQELVEDPLAENGRFREFTQEEAKNVGDRLGIDWSNIDLEQFRVGLSVELEHGSQDSETDVTGNDLLLTGKISWAHLKETPDYYTKLAAAGL